MEELSILVRAAQRGDQDAFAKIVIRFQNMAYAGAYAMTGDAGLAQDVAQEAFIEAYLSLGKLREPAAFPGWFRRILIKQSDRQTRGKRATLIPLEEVDWLPSQMPEPATLVERRQVAQTVQEGIALLPQDQRLAVTLFYIKGYSQKEMAQFLELPVTTIKKRLFTARQKLKERMITMLQEHLQENKPSQSEKFARKVQFFIALRANNLDRVKQLVAEDPDLIHIKTAYDASSRGHYWPLGVTPVYWAAGAGDEALLEFLLSQGADPNSSDPFGLTPLHHAVLMSRDRNIPLLLTQGANIQAETKRGQTPLHHAVIRNDKKMAQLLLAHQAELNASDQRDYTPLDWAVLMGHRDLAEWLQQQGGQQSVAGSDLPDLTVQVRSRSRPVPAGQAVTGRLLNELGQPVDGGASPNSQATQPLYHTMAEVTSPLLETGIKIIDLFVPLPRGGHIGLFTPLSGVGKGVLMNQLIYRTVVFHQGYVVCLGLEEGEYTAKSLVQARRGEFGLTENILAERMVHVFCQGDDPAAKWQQGVETGLTLAESFRREGHEVLLVVDSRLALTEGVFPYLKQYTVKTPEAAVTTLYYGDYTVGLEPAPFSGLDAVITLDLERARQRLYPAVDPLRSWSCLISSELIGQAHVDVAIEGQKLLRRYQELHPQVEKYGLDSLFYLDSRQADEQIAIRARRLQRFLTQPFFGTEPWTGLPGQYTKIEDTLAGCRAILAGEYDALPEEALYFIGTIDQAVRTGDSAGLASAR